MHPNRAFQHEFVDPVHRLRELTSEIQSVAQLLDDSPCRTGDEPFALTGRGIRNIIRARRARETCFLGEPLPDCAWDMILDLMAARVERERICVTSLCLASNAAQSTALRWIRRLLDDGIIERYADPDDCRRSYLKLAEWSAAKVEGLLTFGCLGPW